MRNYPDTAGPYRIFTEDQPQGVLVRKWNADSHGLDYSDPDREDVTVTVPWGRVRSIEGGPGVVEDEDDRTLVGAITPDNSASITAPGAPMEPARPISPESTSRGSSGEPAPADADADSGSDVSSTSGEGEGDTEPGQPAKPATKTAAKTSKAAKKGAPEPIKDPQNGPAKEHPDASTADVRAWAKDHTDLDIADSGPLPDEAYSAYAAAHAD